MILTAKKQMTEKQKLWWAACISANRFRFGFGRQANRTLKDLQLPAENSQPAWVSTVDFIPAFCSELQALKELGGLAPVNSKPRIGRRFCAVSMLFEVQYGTNLELLRLTQSADGVNFVSRTSKNNGVAAKVVRLEEIEPTPGGVLSVAAGGSVLETFVQFQPFYSGRDMYVLRPKDPMTAEELMFYAACIRANQWRYSYGRQANRSLKDLRVPVRSSIPSWVYGSFFRVAETLMEPLAK